MEKRKVVVKYKNVFNYIQFTGFSGLELDIFMLVCAKVRNASNDFFYISYAELKKELGIEKYSNQFIQDKITSIHDKLFHLNYSYCDETLFESARLIDTFAGSLKDRQSNLLGKIMACTLYVRINPDCKKIFTEFSKEFTKFELREFISLESKYSKNLYRLLKQWRINGQTEQYSVDELRALLDYTPEKTTENKYFLKNAINPAVKELIERGYFQNLKVIVVRDQFKRGRPVNAYYFTFAKEEIQKKTPQGNRTAPPRASAKKNKFNNFQQRDFNYDDIEAVMYSS